MKIRVIYDRTDELYTLDAGEYVWVRSVTKDEEKYFTAEVVEAFDSRVPNDGNIQVRPVPKLPNQERDILSIGMHRIVRPTSAQPTRLGWNPEVGFDRAQRYPGGQLQQVAQRRRERFVFEPVEDILVRVDPAVEAPVLEMPYAEGNLENAPEVPLEQNPANEVRVEWLADQIRVRGKISPGRPSKLNTIGRAGGADAGRQAQARIQAGYGVPQVQAVVPNAIVGDNAANLANIAAEVLKDPANQAAWNALQQAHDGKTQD